MKFKKPKFWDLEKQNYAAYLLFPFTIFLRLNNFFLDLNQKKKNHNIKTICVGNIYVGGTGKTPATIRLFNIFKKLNYNVCVGKKHYKEHLDEQIILSNQTNLICKKSRVEILEEASKSKFELILFDDGLQDKDLNYNLKIVCFDANNWIGNGQLIPAGPLREKLNSLKKYDIVFLKNHNSKTNEIKEIIKKQNPLIKIFQMSLNPKNMQNFDLRQKYLIFSGIGDPKNFKKVLLDNNFKVIKEIIFPDHYDYQKDDIDKIRSEAEKLNASIVTTEKDFVKINKIDSKKINFLKISLEFDKEVELIDFIKTRLNEKN